MKRTTNWMPLARHKRSQNTLVVYTLVDGGLAMVDALMRLSSRTEGEFRSPAAGGRSAKRFACSPAVAIGRIALYVAIMFDLLKLRLTGHATHAIAHRWLAARQVGAKRGAGGLECIPVRHLGQ